MVIIEKLIKGRLKYMIKLKYVITLAIVFFITSGQNCSDLKCENDLYDFNFIKTENRICDKVKLFNKSIDSDSGLEYGYVVSGNTPDEFLVLMSNNPIELKENEELKKYDGSSQMIVEISQKSQEFWMREIENVYKELIVLMKNDDKKALIESQKAWENYMKNKQIIEQSFYNKQNYEDIGTLRIALISKENEDEIKRRAYILFEYQYIITGEIRMLFSPEDW